MNPDLSEELPGINPNLNFPIAVGEFKDLVKVGNTFIDKKLLIKEIIQSNENHILITRPRRWGKPSICAC